METEENQVPMELDEDERVGEEASEAETPEDRDVPGEPKTWDSGSEWGEGDTEPEEEEDRYPENEERLKSRRGHAPPVALPSSISPRLRDTLAR